MLRLLAAQSWLGVCLMAGFATSPLADSASAEASQGTHTYKRVGDPVATWN